MVFFLGKVLNAARGEKRPSETGEGEGSGKKPKAKGRAAKPAVPPAESSAASTTLVGKGEPLGVGESGEGGEGGEMPGEPERKKTRATTDPQVLQQVWAEKDCSVPKPTALKH